MLPTGVQQRGFHCSSSPLTITLLLFGVVIKDTATENLGSIKSDYRVLGAVLKGMRTQVVYSSILLSRGKDVRRRTLIGQVNRTGPGLY